MKKTLNINLGGLIFHIDEDAFNKLERYLSALKAQFAKTEGGEEIINDVELRMAELFRQRTSESKEVINEKDVEEVISILGQPEDYMEAEPEEEQPREDTIPPHFKSNRKIYRDGDDRILGGVSSGLAAYFNIDPLWMRILFVVLTIPGFGIPLYIVLWLVVPRAKTTAEKLQMRGEPVTLSNIERAIKDEADQVGKRFREFSNDFDYQSGAKRTGNFISRFFKLIGNLIRLFFKVLFKIIGLFFLIIGFIVLGSILLAILTGGVEIAGSGIAMSDLLDMLQQMMVSDAHYNALMAGLVLLLTAPLFIIIYFGIRLLFDVEPLNKSLRNSLALLAVIGVALTVYSGVRLGLEFNRHAYYSTSEKVAMPASVMHLELEKDSLFKAFYKNGNELPLLLQDKQLVSRMVELNIRKSNKDFPYLHRTVRSQGPHHDKARENARRVDYEVKIDSQAMTFPGYYRLPPEAPFRGQQIELTLYLMPGDSVYLSQEIERLLYDVPNLNNYWDNDMVNHLWLMTEDGLLCADCPDTPEVLEELKRKKAEDEQKRILKEESEGTKVKVDDEKVIISERQAGPASRLRLRGNAFAQEAGYQNAAHMI